MIKQLKLVGCCVLIALLLKYPQVAFSAAGESLELWLDAVLPSLFPFFVATAIFTAYNPYPLKSKIMHAFALPAASLQTVALGLLSGYPVGAALTGALEEKRLIDESTATRLAVLCNTGGAMFIISTVASNMLFSSEVGYVMLICQYIGVAFSCLLMSLFAANIAQFRQETSPPKSQPFGAFLGQACLTGMTNMLKIGGLMAFFSVLYALFSKCGVLALFSVPIDSLLSLLDLPKGTASAIIAGLFEMSIGCNEISQLQISLAYRAALCSFIVSLGGMSVIMQSLSFMKVNIGRYLSFKLIAAAISGVLSYFAVHIAITNDLQGAVQIHKSALPLILGAMLTMILCAIFLFLREKRTS